jgi:hypothetical protein
MAHPHNLTQDTPGLSAAVPEGFQYWVGTVGVGSLGNGDIECLA